MSVCVQAEPSGQLFIIKPVMTDLWQSNKKNKEESLILTLVIMKIEYLKT